MYAREIPSEARASSVPLTLLLHERLAAARPA